MLEAVLALAEPSKSAILMRYFEELTPRAIAARRRAPIATVRSQLQRGLAELRARLDARHGGDRSRWHAGLIAIAGLEAVPAAVPATIAITATKVLAAAALVAGISVIVPQLRERNASNPPPPAPPLATSAPGPEAPDREAIDRTLADASVGPPSATVTGTVHDASGRPIAGAIVSGRSGHPPSATTDADGRYRLALPPCESILLGACASGYARALYRDVAIVLEAPAQLDFTLVSGGSLEGHVLDPDGQPVAGAWVSAGPRFDESWVERDDGERGLQVQEHAATDAQGAFRLGNLAVGLAQVITDATGYPGAMGGATIRAGETTTVTITIRRGATVRGVARTEEGAPIAGAEIRAASLGPSGGGATQTGDDGAFELIGAPAGRTVLTAKGPGETLQARTVLDLADGGSARWDPVLSRGLELRGRVVDHRDRPLAGLWVDLERTRPLEAHAVTDADGRFAQTNWRDFPTRIKVRACDGDRILSPPIAWALDVRASAGEVVIRVPEHAREGAHVTGRILSPDRQALAGMIVVCAVLALDPYASTFVETDADGRFTVGPLTPSRYYLDVNSDAWRFNAVGVLDLAPGERLDLGDIVLAPRGRLIATVHRDRLPAPERLALATMCVRPTALAWALPPNEGIPPEASLPPGDYVAHVRRSSYERGDHGFEIAQRFSIRSGEDTLVEIPARTLAWRTLRFLVPASELPVRSVRYVLRDADGRVLVEDLVMKGLGVEHFVLELGLDPGRYRLTAWTDLYARAEIALDFTAGAGEPLEIALE